ncbi:MAG TPA: exodeoxyribonuclease VII small subunit [Candidatus Baltobacteraceae bacterium]|jgi:exodeoxyribonuclease VII small subunit
MSDAVPQSFEQKLDRIDAIVKQLESNTVPLDKAVELFQEGKRLAAECEALLKNAQATLDKAMGEGQTPA